MIKRVGEVTDCKVRRFENFVVQRKERIRGDVPRVEIRLQRGGSQNDQQQNIQGWAKGSRVVPEADFFAQQDGHIGQDKGETQDHPRKLGSGTQCRSRQHRQRSAVGMGSLFLEQYFHAQRCQKSEEQLSLQGRQQVGKYRCTAEQQEHEGFINRPVEEAGRDYPDCPQDYHKHRNVQCAPCVRGAS
ncbi:hypothetical protein D3C86_1334600 [compost metagenome]